jgi:5-methylcytosine-specific restriction endonuclease McrBC regulatory subunit McrC
VIRCTPGPDGDWLVTVIDAVGTVSVADLQLVVKPKIPTAHLLHLFSKTSKWPRLDSELANLARDESLLELVAHWYLNALEGVLRRDLTRDYRLMVDEVAAVRGWVDAMPTAQLYYSGRLAALCEFEEFDTDTALNRVLKAAALSIVRNPRVQHVRRRRAVQAASRMDDVGDVRHGDLNAETDIRTGYYRDALLLARHVLRGTGRGISSGGEIAWAFLLRTPDLVEEGIRSILTQGLAPNCTVTKSGRQLAGSKLRLIPDLYFSPQGAVGDVKYHLSDRDWSRPDIYQGITFATGFFAEHAAVVSFQPAAHPPLPSLRVGRVNLAHLPWPFSDTLSPEEAERSFLRTARRWLDGIAA